MLTMRGIVLNLLLLRAAALQKPMLGEKREARRITADGEFAMEKTRAALSDDGLADGARTSDGSEIPIVKSWGPGKLASSLIREGELTEDGSFYGMEMVEKTIREDSDLVSKLLEQQKKYPALEVYAKQHPKHPQPGIPLDDPGRLFGVKSTIQEELAAGEGQCDSGGDPHITSWDRGPEWHPMHAPGNWWLVNTEDGSIKVQVQYVGAGNPRNGGWQNTKITVNGKQVPRTANSAIAISGSFINSASGRKNSLVIKPPCEWDRDTLTCINDPNDGFSTAGSTKYRMFWNGVRVESVDFSDPKIKVTPGSTYVIHAGKNDELSVHATPWGGDWSGRDSMWNLRLNMKKPAGKVCGHCGNWNGQKEEHDIWKQWGTYAGTADANGICKADVACNERLIAPRSFGSFDPGTSAQCPEPAGAGFTLEQCKATAAYAPARAVCIASLEGIAFFDQASRFKAMDTCMLDECVQQGFDKDNVQEAVSEDQEEKLGFGAIEDVGEFDNACVVDQVTNVMCDCRAAMPTEAKLICRPGQTCKATMRDHNGQMGEQCA